MCIPPTFEYWLNPKVATWFELCGSIANIPAPGDISPELALVHVFPWSVDLYNPATSIPYSIKLPSFEVSNDTGHWLPAPAIPYSFIFWFAINTGSYVTLLSTGVICSKLYSNLLSSSVLLFIFFIK